MPGGPGWGLVELGRPGGGFSAGRGSQRAVSYIHFYGKLSVDARRPGVRSTLTFLLLHSFGVLSRWWGTDFLINFGIGFLGESLGEV